MTNHLKGTQKRAFFIVHTIITLYNNGNYDKITVYNDLDELLQRKDESNGLENNL